MRVVINTNVLAYAEDIGDAERVGVAIGLVERLPEAAVLLHAAIFPVLVSDWRRAFGRELPFGVVQLPGLDRPHWPAFRDGQRRLAEAIPGMGLITTIDLGNPRDVHPTDKRPVGERLAAWALADVYAGRARPPGRGRSGRSPTRTAV